MAVFRRLGGAIRGAVVLGLAGIVLATAGCDSPGSGRGIGNLVNPPAATYNQPRGKAVRLENSGGNVPIFWGYTDSNGRVQFEDTHDGSLKTVTVRSETNAPKADGPQNANPIEGAEVLITDLETGLRVTATSPEGAALKFTGNEADLYVDIPPRDMLPTDYHWEELLPSSPGYAAAVELARVSSSQGCLGQDEMESYRDSRLFVVSLIQTGLDIAANTSFFTGAGALAEATFETFALGGIIPLERCYDHEVLTLEGFGQPIFDCVPEGEVKDRCGWDPVEECATIARCGGLDTITYINSCTQAWTGQTGEACGIGTSCIEYDDGTAACVDDDIGIGNQPQDEASCERLVDRINSGEITSGTYCSTDGEVIVDISGACSDFGYGEMVADPCDEGTCTEVGIPPRAYCAPGTSTGDNTETGGSDNTGGGNSSGDDGGQGNNPALNYCDPGAHGQNSSTVVVEDDFTRTGDYNGQLGCHLEVHEGNPTISGGALHFDNYARMSVDDVMLPTDMGNACFYGNSQTTRVDVTVPSGEYDVTIHGNTDLRASAQTGTWEWRCHGGVGEGNLPWTDTGVHATGTNAITVTEQRIGNSNWANDEVRVEINGEYVGGSNACFIAGAPLPEIEANGGVEITYMKTSCD